MILLVFIYINPVSRQWEGLGFPEKTRMDFYSKLPYNTA